MHQHWRIIMLARQRKGQLAVADQCKLLPGGVMYGVNLIKTDRLIAHFAGQIGDHYRFDIDGAVVGCLCGGFHVLPFLDLYRLNNRLWLGAGEVDMQQTIFHLRLADIDTVGQHE